MKWDPWLGWAGGGIHNAPWGFFFFFLSPHLLCSACACVCAPSSQTHKRIGTHSPRRHLSLFATLQIHYMLHNTPPSTSQPHHHKHTPAHTLSGTRPSAGYPIQWNDDNLLPRTHRCRRRRRLFPAGFLILIVTLGLTDFFGEVEGLMLIPSTWCLASKLPCSFRGKKLSIGAAVSSDSRLINPPPQCVFLSRQLIHFKSQSFPMDPELGG